MSLVAGCRRIPDIPVTNGYRCDTSPVGWGIADRMTETRSAIERARWDELSRTAALVRAAGHPPASPGRSWRRLAITVTSLAVLTGLGIAAVHAAGTATVARADGTADADLFSLLNQDRTSNGVRSLNHNGTLGAIGEGARYSGCPGLAVNGRAVDMIQRNYFAHPILGCGQLVFSMMGAFGVRYQSAGENIGWNTYGDAASAASAINGSFMASPEHRSNILNGNYTDLGIGSDNSGAAAWTGGGGSYTGAWMFTEEFAQLHSSPPPPPPPPKPRPVSTARPTRNSAAPAAPAVLPAAATAVPVPTAAPTAVPTAPPTAVPTLIFPPLLGDQGGLLFNSVESVLESFLTA
jgi:uncharacterized protein YkwD